MAGGRREHVRADWGWGDNGSGPHVVMEMVEGPAVNLAIVLGSIDPVDQTNDRGIHPLKRLTCRGLLTERPIEPCSPPQHLN